MTVCSDFQFQHPALATSLSPFYQPLLAPRPPSHPRTHSQGVRSLLNTLLVSLPAFWNVGALIFLLFFIYAYMGVLLMGTAPRNGALNEHANFESFWMALLTLFRVATLDNWTDLIEVRACGFWGYGCCYCCCSYSATQQC